jgi:hypothetical protein
MLGVCLLYYALFSFTRVCPVPYFGILRQAYSLVVASFMVGVHWWQYLSGVMDLPINLPITINIIAVFIWILFLVVIDFKLYEKKNLTTLYFVRE